MSKESPKSQKCEILPPENAENRLRLAAQQAKKILGGLKEGDEDALIQATLLQGVVSGDYIAAAITQKLRLQRENLRLKQRIAKTKLQIERQKLRAQILLNNRKERTTPEIITAIREIYGLPPEPKGEKP